MLSKGCLDFLSSYAAGSQYINADPYPYLVIDDFFDTDLAIQISSEYPTYDESFLDGYSNAIEDKKLLNHWNKFGPYTYKAFMYLCSNTFVNLLQAIAIDASPLYADIGLHGGGLHLHSRGGKLNTHLDYSLHPKLNLQRKLNLLVYLTPQWQPQWGGALGLYGNSSDERPGDVRQIIQPLFNRAVLFDVTRNSWHGLPHPIDCPVGKTRNSMAIYYLQELNESVNVLS